MTVFPDMDDRMAQEKHIRRITHKKQVIEL